MNAKTLGKNGLKQNKDYKSQKHLKTLCFKYRVLILDIIWFGICKMVTWYTLTSLCILAERRREDSYESWLRIETVQTYKWLKWKVMHFVASRKLKKDTSATINRLPKGFLSLGVEWKIIDDDDWINLPFSPSLLYSLSY